jgi:Fe-S cluster biosynthesis and repair protein YggX
MPEGGRRHLRPQARTVRRHVTLAAVTASVTFAVGPRQGAGMAEIQCARCGDVGEQLEKAPLRNELGTRVHETICRRCWDQWLKYQTALINHHGLDVRDRPARDFLMANMEAYLFRTGESEQIDTSQQGKISW